jgi:hypothetical protein
VRVRWRQLPGRAGVVEQVARDVVAIVTGHPQRAIEPPVAFPSANLAGRAGDGRAFAQTAQPISYVEAREQLVGATWDSGADIVALLAADGTTVSWRTDAGPRARRTLLDMEKRRRPMITNFRPGIGGHNRRRHVIDPYDGLDEYPPAVWRAVTGGARIGIIELNQTGNAVGCIRLSGEDNETAVGQIAPIVGLQNRFAEEIQLRYLLLAIQMSGKREVRPTRASAPTDGTLERDDMLLLDRWTDEGWLRHTLWRDGDRIARDILPGETLLQRWEKNHVGLWLATYGRQMDYVKDRLQLRAMMMVSAEERDNVTRRLGMAKMNKGPLIGNGWGPLPFGFYRDPATREPRQDLEQAKWVFKAFQYAATGNYLNGEGLSTRKLAEQLAEEGCPFDHDRLGVILRAPIYATGEWTQQVRGIPVAQKPIQLELPVPITLFQTVQNLLSLRKGQSKNTPLGEFLLNYVETVHTQCENERRERNLQPGKVKQEDVDPETYLDKPRLRAHIKPSNPSARRLHHVPYVPDCCRTTGGRGSRGAWTWENDWLEPPIVEAIRQLATHPAVLEEAARAARHEVAISTEALTDDRRAELEREILNLEAQQEEALEAQVARAADGRGMELVTYERIHGRLADRIHAIKTELAMDVQVTAKEKDPSGYDGRIATFLDLMTVERPDDPFHKAMRARLFQRLVSKIEIDDEGEGPITITIYGHLVPPGSPILAGNPVLEGADLIDAYEDWKNGRIPKADQEWGRVQEQIQTALSVESDKAVWSYYADLTLIAGETSRRRTERASTGHTGWSKRSGHSKRPGQSAWVMSISIEPTGT